MLRNLRFFTFVLASVAASAQAQDTPDVLVLGDSQISFGAGEAYLAFFNELPQLCATSRKRKKLLNKLEESRTAAIGVRSTSLQSWTARTGPAKGAVCDVDKKYGVNAGAYGIQGDENRKFVQIGRGKDYQFCAPNKSPFEAIFASGNYRPKLLVLAFLGNSAERWANNPAAAKLDVQQTTAQIPSGIPCIFLTTAPVFKTAVNDIRVKAQAAIVDAFEASGGYCQAVAPNPRCDRRACKVLSTQ